jgi:hypothetical protein
MRLYVAIIILLLVAIAFAVSILAKPIESPLQVDESGPGAWPTYAGVNRVDMIDQHSCMRLIVPYQITSEPRKGITYT